MTDNNPTLNYLLSNLIDDVTFSTHDADLFLGDLVESERFLTPADWSIFNNKIWMLVFAPLLDGDDDWEVEDEIRNDFDYWFNELLFAPKPREYYYKNLHYRFSLEYEDFRQTHDDKTISLIKDMIFRQALELTK